MKKSISVFLAMILVLSFAFFAIASSSDGEEKITDVSNYTQENTDSDINKYSSMNSDERYTDEISEDVEKTENNDSDEMIGKDFKEAMDSYEEFFDEYIAFMKKFSESDGSDLGLLSEYSEYMSKYAEAMKELSEWEEKELNKAETAYYIEVQARINKKLLEVSY